MRELLPVQSPGVATRDSYSTQVEFLQDPRMQWPLLTQGTDTEKMKRWFYKYLQQLFLNVERKDVHGQIFLLYSCCQRG
ncbi:hypothetical protein Y1Q_0001178 [Alligator mississippiensis]|uniref:Uncharacterized protein n=1 Tax=Alligator mississippiensis TaxID=8496 RepID=A0A151PEC6_ALLMI|nr:hypothetical protein Y1Q_0001178 [Alligator mississippiensis]